MSKGKEAGDWDGGLVLREESAAKFYLSRGVPNEPLRGHGYGEAGKRVIRKENVQSGKTGC